MRQHRVFERVGLALIFSRSKSGRLLTIEMDGTVDAPLSLTEHHILDFTHYPSWMDFVHQVTYDQARSSLEVRASLMKHALCSCASFSLVPGGLTWVITAGTLHGASGSVSWWESGDSRTTIELRGSIVRPAFPLPDFMVRWGAQWYLARNARKFIDMIEQNSNEAREISDV